MTRALTKWFFGLKHRLKALKRRPRLARPPDPRIEGEPWLKAVFEQLSERYRLGTEAADGFQVLRRTGRERFNPMRAYLRPSSHTVAGDYDVRVRGDKTLDQGRALLQRRVASPLREWGLSPVREQVEDWGGQVITCRYEGRCDDAQQAAGAVKFMCEESEQVMDVSAE